MLKDRIGSEQLINQSKQGKQELLTKISKTMCLFCQKQFKNTSYLALHYAMRHSQQLSIHFHPHKLLNQSLKEKSTTLQKMLNQGFFKKINNDELNLIFQSYLLSSDRYKYCVNLLSEAINQQKLTQNSQNNYKQNEISQVCAIIAFDMAERNSWITVGWVVLIVFLLFTLLMLTYLHDTSNQQNSNYYKKKTIHCN